MSQQLPPWTDPPPPMPGPAPVAAPFAANGRSRFRPPMRPDMDRPLATWRWWEALAVYLCGILLSVPLVALFRLDGAGTLLASAVLALVEIAVLMVWLRLAHPGWAEAIGFPSRARVLSEAGIGALSGVALFGFVTFVVAGILYVLFSLLSDAPVRAPEQLPADLDGVGRAIAIVYATIVAPFAEEFFFRGVLFRSLRDRHGFWVGAVGSGAAFGLVHYIPGPAIEAVLLMSVMVFTGIGLAYIYERRRNLVAAIAAHTVFNLIGITVIFATQ